MKKLSIEEKAEAYDRALKVLHKYDGANIMFTQSLKEEMFPELKEIEDEKVRKALINVFATHKDYEIFFGVSVKDIIAWLEKQDTQKPADWSEEDEKNLNDIIKDLVHPWNEYIPDRIEDEIKWLKNKLKSLKNRYTWKPSEEQMDALRYVTNFDYGGHKAILVSLYEQLKKLRGE